MDYQFYSSRHECDEHKVVEKASASVSQGEWRNESTHFSSVDKKRLGALSSHCEADGEGKIMKIYRFSFRKSHRGFDIQLNSFVLMNALSEGSALTQAPSGPSKVSELN
jgi:hypothetical protein